MRWTGRGRTNCSGIELSPPVDCDSSSLQLTTHTLRSLFGPVLQLNLRMYPMLVTVSRRKRNAIFVLGVTGFVLAASLWLASADRAIDTDHSTLKIHVGKAGLFSAAGHDHWVIASFAGGSFNYGDPPQVAFIVDARKLELVEDRKLSSEQQAEIQHTMQANVLQSESYPLISFHSSKI